MCGISGIIHWHKPLDQESLKNAIASLHHRGPDGEGYWFSDSGLVGLGHARLGIIAPEDSVQPIINEDGSIVAVVNGEFYGYEEIRTDLLARGHRFRTKTDSEILIHLYEEHGIDCLAHLRGEFSFSLWDAKKQKLFCARDRFGIKPFCYAETNDGILLASEAKAILAMGYQAAWDVDAFFNAASMQYVLPEQTLFRGIKQLKPGYFIVADQYSMKTQQYWDLKWPTEPVSELYECDADYIDQFESEFSEAVKLRMRSDVPICCHLSGGLDSSSVLGAMTKLGEAPASCFTVFFGAEAYDESAFAIETAQKLGSKLYPVHVSQNDIFDHLPEATRFGEGLAINGHISAKYLLNRAIHENGYKVALTGEGADEVLAGYPHLREDLMNVEKSEQKTVDRLYATNSILQGLQLPSGEGLSTSHVKSALGFVPTFLAAKASLGHKLIQVLSTDFMNNFSGRDAYQEMLSGIDTVTQLKGRHVVNQSSYLWSKLALTNYILRTLGDGMEMAHSIEGRVPFLDHKLVEFLAKVPMRLKIKDGVEKYILRQAARPMLTDTIYKRQKHSFMAPPLSIFADPKARDHVRQIFVNHDFSTRTFFESKKMVSLIDKFDDMTVQQLTTIEPIIMMGLTSYFLAKAYQLNS